jgi:hypothetical protein
MASAHTEGVAVAKRADVTEKDVVALKYFNKLTPLLARLHDAGCAGDKPGNRTLHLDSCCSLALLFLFNPIVRSLRAIQQASELKNVQKKLGCARPSLGSLSESVHLFDPTLLKGIIVVLGQQLQPLATGQKLKDLNLKWGTGRALHLHVSRSRGTQSILVCQLRTTGTLYVYDG